MLPRALHRAHPAAHREVEPAADGAGKGDVLEAGKEARLKAGFRAPLLNKRLDDGLAAGIDAAARKAFHKSDFDAEPDSPIGASA